MTENKSIINNLEDLQLERSRLRAKMYGVEIELKEHYKEISDKVKSVTRVFSVVSKFKDMLGMGAKEEESDEPKTFLNTAVKVAIPLVAGGLILKRGKKMLIRSLIGYGLGQATKYIVSKNLDEHVSSVKGMFSEKQEKHEESGIF